METIEARQEGIELFRECGDALRDDGTLERLGRGLYRLAELPPWPIPTWSRRPSRSPRR